MLYPQQSEEGPDRIVLVGLGKENKVDAKGVRKAAASVVGQLKALKV